jgi:hypothetical protein
MAPPFHAHGAACESKYIGRGRGQALLVFRIADDFWLKSSAELTDSEG